LHPIQAVFINTNRIEAKTKIYLAMIDSSDQKSSHMSNLTFVLHALCAQCCEMARNERLDDCSKTASPSKTLSASLSPAISASRRATFSA